jgi:hypothetical protein
MAIGREVGMTRERPAIGTGVCCALGVGLLILSVAACSSAPVAVPPQAIEAYQFQQTLGGVRVGVDPFFTAERTRGSFRGGEDFAEKGLLPVQVVIENGSGADIRVDPRGFRLVRENGDAEVGLSAYDAFSMIRLSAGWWVLGTGVVGGSVPAVRNEGRLKDIQARALQESTIPAGASAGGFVYFALRENEVNLAGHRIVFPVAGPSGQEVIYEIPIAGRRDIPTPTKQPDTAGSPAPSGSAPDGSARPREPVRIEGAGGRGVIIRSPSP